MRGIFEGLRSVAERPKWRGCGFLRTIAELAGTPGHPAIKAGSAHKKRFESWLCGMFERDGIADPAALARDIVVLLDGATTVMLIHRDGDYLRSSGALAERLVSNARPTPR